jgi:hypothetical protein
MLTVEEALERGWEVVVPVQHLTQDRDVILMRHLRFDGKLELGHARAKANEGSSAQA